MSEVNELNVGRFLRLARIGSWEFAERRRGSGVVAILAVTQSEEIVLTEQFRPPVAARVIDLPAGLAGDIDGQEREAFATAARRELEEETGFSAETFHHLATLPSSPGLTSELVDLFAAGALSRVGSGGGDSSEQILVHLVPIATSQEWLEQQVANGRLVDAKVYAALWWHTRE